MFDIFNLNKQPDLISLKAILGYMTKWDTKIKKGNTELSKDETTALITIAALANECLAESSKAEKKRLEKDNMKGPPNAITWI